MLRSDVQVKSITGDDGLTKAKVSVWRKASNTDYHTDDLVEICDVVDVYKNDWSLTATASITIKVCT